MGKKSSQKYVNSLKIKEQLLNKVENIVAKGEIAQLSQCFQKKSAGEASIRGNELRS